MNNEKIQYGWVLEVQTNILGESVTSSRLFLNKEVLMDCIGKEIRLNTIAWVELQKDNHFWTYYSRKGDILFTVTRLAIET